MAFKDATKVTDAVKIGLTPATKEPEHDSDEGNTESEAEEQEDTGGEARSERVLPRTVGKPSDR